MSSRASTGTASRASTAAKAAPKVTANGKRVGRPPKSEEEKAATEAARRERYNASRRAQPKEAALPGGTRVVNMTNGRSQLSKTTDKAARELLGGRSLTKADWAALVGAQPGDVVSVSGTHINYSHGRDAIVNVSLVSKHGPYGNPGGYRADRSIQRDSQGKTFMFNAKFYVDETAQGQGIGTRVLGSEIATATRLGMSYIETNPMNPRANRTWTQMGFRPTKSADGEDVYRFDLTPGSQSHRTYNAYVRARARRSNKQSA